MDMSGGGSSIKSKGGVSSRMRKRQVEPGGIMLASMLDILMAILFFLLKNFSSVTADFNVGKDIVLPNSSAMLPPTPALQLVVTKSAIVLDDKLIANIVNGDIDKKELYKDGVTIVKLAQALKAQKDRSQFIEQRNDSHSFTGTIVKQADKTLKFNLLKKIIYTAGIADFVNLKLAVLKNET
jgi:biopolymer transport protein ExbD